MATKEPTNNKREIYVQEQPLDHFLEKAYRRYAILTILDRALPDARDGLKPVQRRILYAMHDMRLFHNQPHKKSARVVGEVLGKYHPHSDSSVYDAMVRLAQDFSMRTPLIDGQGNFGSIDGDSAAAMRYTEARLTQIGEAMLNDIDKDTVDWRPNFDDSLDEPKVLPSRFPNLLVNGSSGIAVGMSTSILPHNLGEVCDAIVYMANNWSKRGKIKVDELLKFILGPDLPTGGLLYRYRIENEEKVDVIRQAYETGNATLVSQATADIREIGGGKSEIIVTELPYQVQKSTILSRIASHRDKFVGITDVRDESDYNGMRVVFEVARGTDPYDVLDRLLKHTQMRSSLSHNALALVQEEENNGGDATHAVPKYLSLGDMLEEFIKHRLQVIIRRSEFELAKAEARLHIVTGLLKALSMIDEVIDIIRRSQTPDTARSNLMKKLSLSKVQAQAILDMPLRRLASLERKRLEDEQKELKQTVKDLKGILSSEKRRLEVVIEETTAIKDNHATPRKTVISDAEEGHQAQITVSDLVIPEETQICMVTQKGVQRVDKKGYRDSVTVGKSTSRAVTVSLIKFNAEPDENVLFVTNLGRLWYGNVGRCPQDASFAEFGLGRDETIVGASVARAGQYLVLITKEGNVKRVNVEDCCDSRGEATWATIIGLAGKNDAVLFAQVASDNAQVMICSGGTEKTNPRMVRFEANIVNPQATPSARGVTAIKMLDDALIGATVFEPSEYKGGFAILLTEKGHIKRISLDDFPVQGRGGQGVLCWKPGPASGFVIGFVLIPKSGNVDIYSEGYKRLRLAARDIPLATRPGRGLDLFEKYGKKEDLFSNDSMKGVVAS